MVFTNTWDPLIISHHGDRFSARIEYFPSAAYAWYAWQYVFWYLRLFHWGPHLSRQNKPGKKIEISEQTAYGTWTEYSKRHQRRSSDNGWLLNSTPLLSDTIWTDGANRAMVHVTWCYDYFSVPFTMDINACLHLLRACLSLSLTVASTTPNQVVSR